MQAAMLSLLVGFMSISAPAKIYQCVGSEPFFRINIRGSNLEYMDSENHGFVTTVAGPWDAAGMPSDFVFVYKSKPKDLQVTMVAGKCQGSSDTEYLYHMVYTRKGTVLYGCCNPIQ
jgi:uncharacterized membrane protein